MVETVIDERVRQEIADLIASQDAAWNRGDAAAFAARCLPDVVFTNVLGMFTVGKAPFLAQHERIFATIYKGTINHQEVQHITLVKPDVAVVDTLSTMSGVAHGPPGIPVVDGTIQARLEQVLVRHDDGWWIVAFHNVAVNQAALAAIAPPR